MKKSKLQKVARKLLKASKTLATISQPNSKGFKAAQAWLYDREDLLAEAYSIKRKDIYSLTFEINAQAATLKKKKKGLSIED